MYSTLYSKVVSGCVLLLITLTSGVAPYVLLRHITAKGSRHSNKTASRINSAQAFASGIFIATCLLHLFPEALEAIKKSLKSDLPVCEILVSFGFLLLLATENLIIGCHEAGRERSVTVIVPGHQHPVNDSDENSNENNSFRSTSPETRPTYGIGDCSSDDRQYRNTPPVYGSGSVTQRQDYDVDADEESDYNENCPILKDEKDVTARNTSSKDNKDAERKKAVLKSFVLLFALSLHTVFDGLVVGLQSDQREVWTLLVAVGLHKALVAISIALSLLESHHDHPHASLLYIFFFSLVAPVGLAIGVVLTEVRFNKHAQMLTAGVLQSVATGTFMYVTFVESLKGRFDDGDRMLNVLWVLLGFGLVCGLRILLPS